MLFFVGSRKRGVQESAVCDIPVSFVDKEKKTRIIGQVLENTSRCFDHPT